MSSKIIMGQNEPRKSPHHQDSEVSEVVTQADGLASI